MTATRWTKLAPLAVFAVAVGFCAWPYLNRSTTPTTPATPAAPLPTLPTAWLDPEIGPAPARDPFARPDAATPKIAAPAPVPAPAQGGVVARAAGGAATKAAAGTSRSPSVAPAEPSFVLGATLVHGARRAAIIDGRVYAEGDAIRDGQGGTPWRLARVEIDSVKLARGGATRPVRLAFARADGGAGPAAAARVTPGGVGPPPGPPDGPAGRSDGDLGLAYLDLYRMALDPAAWARQGKSGPPGPGGHSR